MGGPHINYLAYRQLMTLKTSFNLTEIHDNVSNKTHGYDKTENIYFYFVTYFKSYKYIRRSFGNCHHFQTFTSLPQ